MTMLQRNSSHAACSAHIQSYLEWDGSRPRAIASRFIGLLPGEEQLDWAQAMDAMREWSGNDGMYGSKRSVTYYHYVISPDPNDDKGIGDLMDLAQAWAEEFFGTDFGEGELGQCQVAIVAHDDGSNGVPHAHIIVNNTDLPSGNKIHIDNAQKDMLWDRLQEISEERGFSRLDDARDYRKQKRQEEVARRRLITSGRYQTKVERKLAKSGAHSWKQDLANCIKIARRTSGTLEELELALGRMGVQMRECVNAKGEADLIYSHPSNPARWQCSGYRLGLTYTRASIIDSLELDHAQHPPRDLAVRERATAFAIKGFVEGLEPAAVAAQGARLADIARALEVNDRFNVACLEDYPRAIRRLEKRLSDPITDEGRRGIKRDIARLRRASEIASESDLFLDIPDKGQKRFAEAEDGRPKPNARKRKVAKRGERAGRGSSDRSRVADRGQDKGARGAERRGAHSRS